jgi:hypothetical protein
LYIDPIINLIVRPKELPYDSIVDITTEESIEKTALENQQRIEHAANIALQKNEKKNENEKLNFQNFEKFQKFENSNSSYFDKEFDGDSSNLEDDINRHFKINTDINDRIYDDKYNIKNNSNNNSQNFEKTYSQNNFKKYGYDNEYVENKNKPFDIKETYKKLYKNGCENHRNFLEKSRTSTHIIGLGREEKMRYADNQRYTSFNVFL